MRSQKANKTAVCMTSPASGKYIISKSKIVSEDGVRLRLEDLYVVLHKKYYVFEDKIVYRKQVAPWIQ